MEVTVSSCQSKWTLICGEPTRPLGAKTHLDQIRLFTALFCDGANFWTDTMGYMGDHVGLPTMNR
jgi:hypothetical protein